MPKPQVRQPDLEVEGHGSVFLLRPLTDAGQEWVDNNLDPDAMTWVNAKVVEHRYIRDIVSGAQRDGLRVI